MTTVSSASPGLARPATRSNRLFGPLPDVQGEAGYEADHPARVGFFTDTSVCIGCKACEVACKEWNTLPMDDSHGTQDALGLSGMSYDNTGQLGANSWRHVAFIEQSRDGRPADAGRRAARRDRRRRRAAGRPDQPDGDSLAERADRACSTPRRSASSTRRPGSRRDQQIRWLMSLRRLQALHARRLPGRLPDRRAVPHRVRHRRRPGRHLQRLRLLRARLPVRRHRPAQGRRPGLQVHDVLRPADRRADAGLRDRLPDPVDPVRRPRRAAGAGRRPAGDAARRRAWRRRGCTGGTRTTASAATGRSSCCSTSRRSTACRRTRSSPRATCRRCGRPRPTGAAMIVGVGASAFAGLAEAVTSMSRGRRRTPGAGWRRAGGADLTQSRGASAAGAAGGWGGGSREAAMVPTTPSSPRTTAARSSRRRCGRTPTCRCTCSWAGRRARRRSSGRWPSSPGRPALTRVARVRGRRAGRWPRSCCLIARPGPAGAVPAHAAGVQADVAAVGGLLHPVAVQRG